MGSERLERVVTASVDDDLADKIGSEGERGCSACQLRPCRIGVIRDLAGDKGERQRGCVMECDSKLMDEQLTRCLVTRTVHEDVMNVVQRGGQTDPTRRVRACRVIHLVQPVSVLLCRQTVRSEASSDSNHRVTLQAEKQ